MERHGTDIPLKDEHYCDYIPSTSSDAYVFQTSHKRMFRLEQNEEQHSSYIDKISRLSLSEEGSDAQLLAVFGIVSEADCSEAALEDSTTSRAA
eukprot:1275099-Amphidinium_carterae.1